MAGPVLTSDRGTRLRPPICWPLLPVPDSSGRLLYPDLEASVRQRIEAVLRTAPGEQLMRPGFGAGLDQSIHQPNTTAFRSELQARIASHVRAYEPRISLDHVEVMESGDTSTLLVTIAYRIHEIGVASTVSLALPVGDA